MATVTFLRQVEPMDEYGRALYAVTGSIIRAMIDQLSSEDLADLNCTNETITLRQFSKLARLERDKGMKGDGFEWAVHEAIVGGEPLVLEPVSEALTKVSKKLVTDHPTSLLFGH